MNCASHSGSRYSVMFLGTFSSGPTTPPCWFTLWHEMQWARNSA